MDLNKLFKAQAELDKHIVDEKGLEGQDLLKKKTVALICELYELVNESRFFKYWSNKSMNRDNALEEFTDTIHFAISIANDAGLDDYEFGDSRSRDLNDLTLGITNLATLIPERPTKNNVRTLLNLIIKLGYQLGFTEDEVIEAYHSKNKENHIRQESGY